MGTCISTSCKRGRRRNGDPQIKDTALPKDTSPNCPTPSHGPNPGKDEVGQTQCISPQKPSEGPLDCAQEKRVVGHETLRDPHSSPARAPIRSLKENKNVNLSSKISKPARAFSGKPIDRQIHVGRRSQEATPTRPRPCRAAASPARGFELTSSRKPDCVENRAQRVPVKRQNFGDLRSGSPSSRATRGSGIKSGDSSRRANSSTSSSQIRGKNIACFEPQKLREEVAEKPKNVCKLPHEAAEISNNVYELPAEVTEKPKIVCELYAKVGEKPQKVCELSAEVAEKPKIVCDLYAEVAKNSKNMCELPAEIASVTESEFDSSLPPVDLENPLISLDCFIFL